MDIAWNPLHWKPCAVKAMKLIIRKMLWAVKQISKERHGSCEFQTCALDRDYGPVYLAVLLGEAYDICMRKDGNCLGTSWRELEGLIEYSPPIHALFLKWKRGYFPTYQMFKGRVLSAIMNEERNTDVLSFGPYGFHNEPFFTPSLVLPSKSLAVTTLMIPRESFATSLVRIAHFPWTLQNDVEMGAIFLRDAIYRLQARYVFPGDSIGVQMIAKAGHRLYHLKHASLASVFVRETLARSSPWPPTYPPLTLSKLIPGHEKFAPQEAILTQNDILSEISPDMTLVKKIYSSFGNESFGVNATVYLKKEFSEAGRGVKRIKRFEDFQEAFDDLFPRLDGIGLTDLEMKVRIFIQRNIPVTRARKPVGYRFYAEQGRVFAAHLSMVDRSTDLYGVSYVTIRDPIVEQDSEEFIKIINYTGFGAIWWWLGAQGKPYLIDFNPRLERQACINSIHSLPADPCTMFQFVANGTNMKGWDLPLMAPAGMKYLEPMRIVNMGLKPKIGHFVDMLRNQTEFPWNIHSGDKKLFEVHLSEAKYFIESWDKKYRKT